MNPIEKLIELFGMNKKDVTDYLMKANANRLIDSYNLPEFENIIKALEAFDERDEVNIFLEDESEDSIFISKNNFEEYEEFKRNLDGTDIRINVNIEIKKNIYNQKISIFNFECFKEKFLDMTIVENLKFFSSRFEYNSNIIFVNYDNGSNFNTHSIIMMNNDSQVNVKDNERKSILEKCKSASNFINNIEYSLIPEDFDLHVANIDEKFIERFNIIKTLLSLAYIVDYSSIEGDYLKLKLNGYRNKDYVIDIKKFVYINKYDEFYKIYTWIFQEGNEFDKISLTRHVMSMYCKYSDILDIDERTFLSIKSNYNIYLKENVDKYIELKNKVMEFISETTMQVNTIINDFIDSFKKNIASFLTFFLGTIIANLVSDSPLDNILTKDIKRLLMCILAGSFIYLIFSILECCFKFISYKNSYLYLKKSYEDVLNENDLKIIFDNDNDYKKNKNIVKTMITLFSILWLILIIVIYIWVILWGECNILKNILQNIFYEIL